MDKQPRCLKQVSCPTCGRDMWWDDSEVDSPCDVCLDPKGLLSDLAEVEVPPLGVSLDALLNAEPQGKHKSIAAITGFVETMRPLIERAKKVRGTDKV